MTAFRVVQGSTVHYLHTPLEPQLHNPNRLWQPRRFTGHSPSRDRARPEHRLPVGLKCSQALAGRLGLWSPKADWAMALR